MSYIAWREISRTHSTKPKVRYTKEIEFLEQVEEANNPQNEREKLTETELSKLRLTHPNLPVEYLGYLKEIGAGSFRECQFVVHDQLFDLEDFGLEELYEVEDGIKFFGENFSGDFSGFDLKNDDGLVVELWHECGTLFETKRTFRAYIREQMLMGEDGEDTRIKTEESD